MSQPNASGPLEPTEPSTIPLPPTHKVLRQLNDLLSEITQSRAEMLRWELSVSDLERRLSSELQPLEAKIIELRIATYHILDKHLQAGWLNRRDHQLLEGALFELARDLEENYGIELGESENDDDENPEEDIRSSIYRETDFPPRPKLESKSGQSQKSESHLPPKTKPEISEEIFAGDLRALYLMLARALHPDKELDPTRREAKTGWMQKVTSAYGEHDLARLLDILGQNPLNAVGPYLAQAPQKTVQSYAKRLRRDLETVKQRLLVFEASLDPFLSGFLKAGNVNEAAYNIHLAKARKDIKFLKQRRDAYATTQGVQSLMATLRHHEWHELM
jgi:hypothetical protein